MSSSFVDATGTQGGYTKLLLGVHQDASSAVRKLHFDGVPNNENIWLYFLNYYFSGVSSYYKHVLNDPMCIKQCIFFQTQNN
jgi:hypothetical protein